MKPFILLMLILVPALAPVSPVWACASCGCGAGGYYLGLLPLQTRNFLGLRYRTALYHTSDPTAPAEYQPLFRTKEYFQTVEAIGRVYLHPRLQLMAFVPYQFHQQQTATETYTTQGLGDAMAFLNFRAFSNIGDTTATAFRHSLWLGLGIKGATGRYKASNAGERSVANANFMLGTGSWDPMATLSYQIRRRRTGISFDASGRYTTQNSKGYRFGHRATAALSVYTIRQRRGWGLMPSAGLYTEASTADRNGTDRIAFTGGRLAAAQATVDLYFGTWSAGVLTQLPFSQHMAGGSQKAKPRLMLQVGYAF